jgi:hypothetical protein
MALIASMPRSPRFLVSKIKAMARRSISLASPLSCTTCLQHVNVSLIISISSIIWQTLLFKVSQVLTLIIDLFLQASNLEFALPDPLLVGIFQSVLLVAIRITVFTALWTFFADATFSQVTAAFTNVVNSGRFIDVTLGAAWWQIPTEY